MEGYANEDFDLAVTTYGLATLALVAVAFLLWNNFPYPVPTHREMRRPVPRISGRRP